MINSLNDKHILYDLRKDIIPYVIKYRTKKMDKADDNLTKEQTIQLDEAIRQADAGETVTMEEFKQKFAKWLPDESKRKTKKEKKIAKNSKKKLRKEIHAFIDGVDSKYLLNVLLDIMPDALNNSKYD